MAQAFLCDGVRTPIGRYAGVLAKVRTDDLAAVPIRALMARNPNVEWEAVDEVYLGCANLAGRPQLALRVAADEELRPGDRDHLALMRPRRDDQEYLHGHVRLRWAARAVRAGDIELAIAGGVESMTRAPFVMGKAQDAFQRTSEIYDTTIGWRFVNPVLKAQYGIDSMPETGENVAEEYQVTRADQDQFALRSQQRAGRAIASGFFAEEIVPVEAPGGKGGPIRVDKDEHPRPDTTLEGLAKLKTPFRNPGTVTAGNASGVNDGAAAMIIASEAAVKRHGLKPRARVIGAASAGVPPRIMGIGPVPATRKLMERHKLKIAEFDVIELNEAFAAQSLAVLRQLGLSDDAEHVNPNGGAIALGHPLGMSGARLALTATHQLEKTGGKLGLATLCVGVGQGAALALERVG